ncbi:MAG: VWA domain-containing protein [Gammaproteobacteria bacterium]|nr:VWA domain-containing protein [Gammaproteobacteria bacterium]
MFSFAWPWMFLLLPVPALVYRVFPAAKTGQAALRVPFYEPISRLSENRRKGPGALKTLTMALIWCLLLCAAARPQWVGETQPITVSGRDLMLAVDISESMKTRDMLIEDELVDRVTAVKLVAQEFIERRTGDRIGLILFGSQAYLQTPLSFDRKTVNTFLQEAVIGIAGRKTAIGDAVGLAIKRLRDPHPDRADTDNVLILLTDGANTAGIMEPLQAAQLAQSAGLKIYTIGVGADPSMVNRLFGQRLLNPSSDLDEETLVSMARATAGRYFRARDGDSLEQIYDIIDKLEPVQDESKFLRPVTELFHLPLACASLVALVLGFLSIGLPEILWQPFSSFKTRGSPRT